MLCEPQNGSCPWRDLNLDHAVRSLVTVPVDVTVIKEGFTMSSGDNIRCAIQVTEFNITQFETLVFTSTLSGSGTFINCLLFVNSSFVGYWYY